MSAPQPVQRSVYHIAIPELLAAILTGVGSWFSLRYVLWNSPPWEMLWCYPTSCTEAQFPGWFIQGRQRLFDTYSFPISFFLAISVVFLIRAIRKDDIIHFSRLSNFAIAMPLILFPALMTLGSFGLWCSIFGVGPAVASLITWFQDKANWGGFASFLWYILWLWFSFVYIEAWFAVYGD